MAKKPTKKKPKKATRSPKAKAPAKKAARKAAPKLKAVSPSHWIKILSSHGNVRGVAIQATALVRELAARHGNDGLYAQRWGEAAISGMVTASNCKNGQRVNLNIRGSGHYQQALVDAYPDGRVRGYVVGRDIAYLGSKQTGDETGRWGTGVLSVLRTKEQSGQAPYIGTVPLLTGHLAKDLTFYWHQSEQTPSAVGIAVSTNAKGEITTAGGFMVQVLPGASLEEVRSIERNIQAIQSLAVVMANDEDPMHLLGHIFQDSTFAIVEKKKIYFQCECSRPRVERALMLVGVAELQAMLKEDGNAVVTCDFCSKKYKMTAPQLKGMIRSIQEHEEAKPR